MKKLVIIASVSISTIILNPFMYLFAQNHDKPHEQRQKEYNIEQAISDRAQLTTIAFNGLAFITGSLGADCFFPPGKVADYFGFQYMRDNDKNEMGHNTDFLTKIANNVIYILNPEQLQQLKDLASDQAQDYDNFALQRLTLIKAFRDQLDEKIPSGRKELSKDAVVEYCSRLYLIDSYLSYNRAVVLGKIINSLSQSQKEYLGKLDFNNSSTWPDLPESLDKKNMKHREHVCVMTYASELFSWYAGSIVADIYFCPERHGTYFGGFFLKDYPAMGNHGYNISTSLTGDKGEEFIKMLSSEQVDWLKQAVKDADSILKEIVNVRTEISKELRKAINNENPDKEKVDSLIKIYGGLDGEFSYNSAVCFSKINKSLTDKQRQQLIEIRDLDVVPEGTFLYSDPIEMPANGNIDYFFK